MFIVNVFMVLIVVKLNIFFFISIKYIVIVLMLVFIREIINEFKYLMLVF